MTGEADGATSGPAADGGQVGRRLFANFSFLFLAQVVTALAGLVSTAWLARAVGTGAYGILGFGSALVAYFGLLVVAGTDVYGMRAIAQNTGAVAGIVRRILGLRVPLLVAALAAYLIVVHIIGSDGRTRAVLSIQGASLIVTAFTLDFVFQGVQRMGAVAVRQAMAAVLSLCGVLILIRNPADIYVAAGIPVTALAVSAMWLAFRMHRHLTPVALTFEAATWRPMMAAVFPIMIAQGVNAVYNQMDILMLGVMAAPRETGLYVGMSRLYAMAVMVGGLLGTVFSPALAGAWPDTESMRERYREFLTVCVFVGAPVAAISILWPDEIIAIVFGSGFVAGRSALVFLMATAFLTYASYPVTAALLVWHDQKVEVVLMAAGAGLNILLNLLLIPAYGIVGAAVATLAAQAFLLVVLLLRLRTRFGLWEVSTAVKLAMTALAVFAPASVLFGSGAAVRGPVWFAFVVHAGVGGIVYVAATAAFGLVKPGQLLALFRGPARKNAD